MAVVDLRALWDKSPVSAGGKWKLLVVRSLKDDLRVCFAVDEVREIRRFAAGEITNEPDNSAGSYQSGSADFNGSSLCVIDAEQFLSSSRLRQFE